MLGRRLFSSVTSGVKYTNEFQQYLKLSNGSLGSYFHDIEMRPAVIGSNNPGASIGTNGNVVNMVVEVPRWSNAKFEISTSLPLNPIVQDTKKSKLRFVNNIFPYKGYITNYGAIPQTWEDPAINSGDNDPLDCCEIGSGILETGTVAQVKVLGSLALIDDGEMDWKIIAINLKDPLCDKVNTLDDVNKYFPGILSGIRYWFKNYKIPTNKPENKFAFNGDYLSIDKTLGVLEECHQSWANLIKKQELKEENGLPCTYRSSTIDKPNDRYNIKESTLPGLNLGKSAESVTFDKNWHYV